MPVEANNHTSTPRGHWEGNSMQPMTSVQMRELENMSGYDTAEHISSPSSMSSTPSTHPPHDYDEAKPRKRGSRLKDPRRASANNNSPAHSLTRNQSKVSIDVDSGQALSRDPSRSSLIRNASKSSLHSVKRDPSRASIRNSINVDDAQPFKRTQSRSSMKSINVDDPTVVEGETASILSPTSSVSSLTSFTSSGTNKRAGIRSSRRGGSGYGVSVDVDLANQTALMVNQRDFASPGGEDRVPSQKPPRSPPFQKDPRLEELVSAVLRREQQVDLSVRGASPVGTQRNPILPNSASQQIQGNEEIGELAAMIVKSAEIMISTRAPVISNSENQEHHADPLQLDELASKIIAKSGEVELPATLPSKLSEVLEDDLANIASQIMANAEAVLVQDFVNAKQDETVALLASEIIAHANEVPLPLTEENIALKEISETKDEPPRESFVMRSLVAQIIANASSDVVDEAEVAHSNNVSCSDSNDASNAARPALDAASPPETTDTVASNMVAEPVTVIMKEDSPSFESESTTSTVTLIPADEAQVKRIPSTSTLVQNDADRQEMIELFAAQERFKSEEAASLSVKIEEIVSTISFDSKSNGAVDVPNPNAHTDDHAPNSSTQVEASSSQRSDDDMEVRTIDVVKKMEAPNAAYVPHKQHVKKDERDALAVVAIGTGITIGVALVLGMAILLQRMKR